MMSSLPYAPNLKDPTLLLKSEIVYICSNSLAPFSHPLPHLGKKLLELNIVHCLLYACKDRVEVYWKEITKTLKDLI